MLASVFHNAQYNTSDLLAVGYFNLKLLKINSSLNSIKPFCRLSSEVYN